MTSRRAFFSSAAAMPAAALTIKPPAVKPPVQPLPEDWDLHLVSLSDSPNPGRLILTARIAVKKMRDGSQWEAYRLINGHPAEMVSGKVCYRTVADDDWCGGGVGSGTEAICHFDVPRAGGSVVVWVAVLNCRGDFNPWVSPATRWKSVAANWAV